MMGGLVWFDKTVQACQGPTSFIAYERLGDISVFPCFSQWWFSHDTYAMLRKRTRVTEIKFDKANAQK
jgi:hypothetical protein